MALVIIALIIFGIGTVALIIDTFTHPKPIKIIASIVFSICYGAAIVWALKEFVN